MVQFSFPTKIAGHRPGTEEQSRPTSQSNKQHRILTLFHLDFPGAKDPGQAAHLPRGKDPRRRGTLRRPWIRAEEAQDRVETHPYTSAPLPGAGARLHCRRRRWPWCRQGVRRNAPRLLSLQGPSADRGRTSRPTSSASWSAASPAPGCAPPAAAAPAARALRLRLLLLLRRRGHDGRAAHPVALTGDGGGRPLRRRLPRVACRRAAQ